MKTSSWMARLLLVSVITSRNLPRHQKRSVFDLIEENKKVKHTEENEKETIHLSWVLEKNTGITYQHLRKIINKTNKRRKRQSKRYTKQKEELKKYFKIKERKKMSKRRNKKENKENVLLIFHHNKMS